MIKINSRAESTVLFTIYILYLTICWITNSSRRVAKPQREGIHIIRVICGYLIPRDHKIKRDLLNTNFTKILKWMPDK